MDRTALLYEREELMKSLLNVEDIDLIKKFRSMLKRETAKLPAVMTVDEMRTSAFKGFEEAKQGKGKPMEQLFEEVKGW